MGSKSTKSWFESAKDYRASISLLFALIGDAGFTLTEFGETIYLTRGKWFTSIEGIFFLVSIVFLILALILQLIDACETRKLERNNLALEERLSGQLDMFVISSVLLEALSNQLNFSYSERITVFKFNDKEDFFIPIARYSKNITFNKKHRTTYSTSQGCVASAWRSSSGTCDTGPLPDYSKDPKSYKNTCLRTWNVPKPVTDGLSMKSRRYYGSVIHSHGKPSTSIGVIVFETLNDKFPTYHSGAKIEEILRTSGIFNVLVWTVEKSPSSVIFE